MHNQPRTAALGSPACGRGQQCSLGAAIIAAIFTVSLNTHVSEFSSRSGPIKSGAESLRPEARAPMGRLQKTGPERNGHGAQCQAPSQTPGCRFCLRQKRGWLSIKEAWLTPGANPLTDRVSAGCHL